MTTIRYVKKKRGAEGEIVTGVLNVMKVVTKVAGLPEDRRLELKRIIDMVEDKNLSWKDEVKGEVEKYVKEMLQEMSVMPVEVKCGRFERSEGKNRDIYGTIEMTYTPSASGKSGISHTVQLNMWSGHGELVLVPTKTDLEPKDRDEIESQRVKCEKDGSLLGKRAAGSIQRFLDKVDLASIPHEVIEGVENARNDIERYEKISRLLMEQEIMTADDKLRTLDLFVPFLDKETQEICRSRKEEDPAAGEPVPGHSESGGYGLLENKDPLLHLIANIVGSVPLQDAATRIVFLEVMRFCHDEHGGLFPKIQLCQGQFGELTFESCRDEMIFLIGTMIHYNVPNMLFKYFARLRMADEGNYLKDLQRILGQDLKIYSTLLFRYIQNGHDGGIEAAMRDLVEIGPGCKTFYMMVAVWLSVSTYTNFREGIEFAGDCYEKILIPSFHDRFRCYGEAPWFPPSDTLRDGICSDRARTVRLLRLYTGFSIKEIHFNALYELIKRHYDTIGVEGLLECLRDMLFLSSDAYGGIIYLPQVVEPYLIRVRNFTEKMKPLLEAKEDVDVSVLAALEAIHEVCMDLQEDATDE